MPTAYEDGLSRLKADIDAISANPDSPMRGASAYVPSYGLQLESHGDISGGGFLSGLERLVKAIPGTLANADDYIISSLVSGTAQLYNSGVELANWAGADVDKMNTHRVLANIDNDISRWYNENKEAADLTGFIVGSIIPGAIGVKGVRMFQSSAMMQGAINNAAYGKGMQRALGILAPQRQKHLAAAIKQATTSDTVFKATNANLLKAMGAGFGQNVIEIAAAETMTYAMMNDSPILEGQDFGDFISNVAFSSVAFGAIGGAVGGASDYYKVKKAVTKANVEAMPWTHKNAYPGNDPQAEMSLALKQINDIPPVTDEVVATIDDAETAVKRKQYLQKKAVDKVESLQRDIREAATKIAGGDQVQAQALYESIILQPDYQSKIGRTVGLKEAARVNVPTKQELKMLALSSKMQAGKASIEEAEEFMNLNVGYQKNWGRDTSVAEISDVAPIVTQLSDVVDDININPKKMTLKAGDKTYKVDPKLNDFDIMNSTPLEVNARHIIAQKSAPFSEWKAVKEIKVKDTDIPFLDKIHNEYDDAVAAGVKLVDTTGEVSVVSKLPSKEGYTKWLAARKKQLAAELQATKEAKIGSDPKLIADRLRAITGIPFVLSNKGSMSTKHGMHEFIGRQLAASNKLANSNIDLNTNLGFRRISMNTNDLTNRPMQDLVSTLKHEEGHDLFTSVVQNGGITPGDKATSNAIVAEMKLISRKMREESWDAYDRLHNISKTKALTAQQKAYVEYMDSQHELAADTFSYFSQYRKQAAELAPTFDKNLGHLVNEIPEEVVAEYTNRAMKLQEQEIAAMLNVSPSYLNGNIIEDAADGTKGMMYMQESAKEYSARLRAAGQLGQQAPDIDIFRVPQHTKLAYDSNPFKTMDNFEVEAMSYYKAQNKLYMDGVRVATSSVLGEYAENLPKSLAIDTRAANNFGAGAGGVSFANGNYGSLASMAEWMGRYTTKIKSGFRDKTQEALTAPIVKLAGNTEAAVEFSTLNAKLRSIPENYLVDMKGSQFKLAGLSRWEAAVEEAKKLVDEATELADPKQLKKAQTALDKLKAKRPIPETIDAPEVIPIKHKETLELAKVHVELNGNRVNSYRKIRNAQGVMYNRDPEAFYPTPVNPKEYPYFAIVSDERVTSSWGSHSTLYATSADELESMANQITSGNKAYRVRTGKDAEDYYKSIGQWVDEKTINENYFDITKKRKGVSAPFLPATDPKKVTDDLLNWHLSKDSGLVNETMLAHYEDKFEELRMLGESHTNFQTSKFTNVRQLKHLEDVVDNPFTDYIRTSLGMTNNAKYPLWTSINKTADEAVSKFAAKISSSVHRAKSPEQLEAIGAAMEDAGYPGFKYTADMEMFANAEMPRGMLESFVRKANSLLSTITLRMDSVQAINNAVSSSVLTGAEVKAVLRAIDAGDEHAVGKLAALAKTKIPEGSNTILSPTKLISKSYERYRKMLSGDPAMVALRDQYKANGFITSISDQYKWSLDQLTFTGKETVAQMDGAVKTLHQRLRDFADAGEKWTGNKLAEEMNRFVSADIMKQLTDIAVDAGKLGKDEALSYINTFVSRTQGNYLAAQRPALFKGAIGQSIGLFQTYQFNLIQQLLRHVGEGAGKDAATLLGLQTAIHGMHGLPAFDAINSHIVGNASGNQSHRDLYDATYTVAGKEAGDWLLYGAGSNFLSLVHPDLGFNLYTRGDLNPRHLTIVPNSVQTVPWVSAYGKFLNNFLETGKKMFTGGDATSTLLQGIEHNGLSRPLAGIAQSLEAATNPRMQGFSTSNAGNVVAANDFLSLATAVRMIGAKPLDEAIALDTVYRLQSYGLKDAKKTQLLGEALKTKMIGGQLPQREELMGFMRNYVEMGGTQENFSKWARGMYKSANLSQANKLGADLNTWEGQHIQKVLGGEVPEDFYDVSP